MTERIANLTAHVRAANDLVPEPPKTIVPGGAEFGMSEAERLTYVYAALMRINDERAVAALKELTSEKPETLKKIKDWADSFFGARR
jgi:hypothetical protein